MNGDHERLLDRASQGDARSLLRLGCEGLSREEGEPTGRVAQHDSALQHAVVEGLPQATGEHRQAVVEVNGHHLPLKGPSLR